MKELFVKSFLYTLLILCSSQLVAQTNQELATRLDSLEKEQAATSKLARSLSKIKISGYIQGQYQYGEKNAKLKVGDSNEDAEKGFHRFGIRRGRVSIGYYDGIGMGVVQLNVSDKDGVEFRDLYIGAKDPWTQRSSALFGFYSVPFGYETRHSTSALESPERTHMIQALFPDERDLGLMLTLRSPQSTGWLSLLQLDLAIVAGNSIRMETDSRKNFVGKLAMSDKKDNGLDWGVGISYYNGSTHSPTSYVYELSGDAFVKQERAKAGGYMKREYVGVDARLGFPSAIGHTTLRGEYILGQQPGTATDISSPKYKKRPTDLPEHALYKRSFSGWFVTLAQRITETPLTLVVKYEHHDPNRKLEGDKIGIENSNTHASDLYVNSWGLGAIYDFNKHIRLLAYYDIIANEKASNLDGWNSNRKDNTFTLRLQYKF